MDRVLLSVPQLLRIDIAARGEGDELDMHARLSLVHETTLPRHFHGEEGGDPPQIYDINMVGVEQTNDVGCHGDQIERGIGQ